MAWGTAWLHRYREDPFFQTEVNVVSLQVAFASVILLFVAASFTVINHGITQAARAVIAQSAQSTPLSIIKTNTEIALLGDDLSAEMKQTLASNVEELDRISEIINNLLSLSTLIRPERIEFGPVDLGEVVTNVVAKFGPLAKTSGHQLTVRRSPETLVWGNETGLEQIAGNLLKNAISYTPRGGTITLTVSHTNDSGIEFLIQDSGVGISRKDLFRIFEPFYRADPSRNRAQGGSGLGLAIVSELIKLHKGRITIRSAVGRGTNVSIVFPAARSQAKVGSKERFEGLNEIAVDYSG